MNESPYSASQVYKEQGVGIQGGDELRASVVEARGNESASQAGRGQAVAPTMSRSFA